MAWRLCLIAEVTAFSSPICFFSAAKEGELRFLSRRTAQYIASATVFLSASALRAILVL